MYKKSHYLGSGLKFKYLIIYFLFDFCSLASLAFPCSTVISPFAIACLTFAAAFLDVCDLFLLAQQEEDLDAIFALVSLHEAFSDFELHSALATSFLEEHSVVFLLEQQEAFLALFLLVKLNPLDFLFSLECFYLFLLFKLDFGTARVI